MIVKPLFKLDVSAISSLKITQCPLYLCDCFCKVSTSARQSVCVCGHRRLQLSNISFSSVTDASHSAIEKPYQQRSYLARSLSNIDLQSLK